MNKAFLLGRLVRDPTYKEIENEKGVYRIAAYTLAVRNPYKTKADFIRIKTFGSQAEFVRDNFRQGSKIALSGSISTGSYKDKNTQKMVYTTEVYTESIEFAGPKVEIPEESVSDEYMDIPDDMVDEMPFE